MSPAQSPFNLRAWSLRAKLIAFILLTLIVVLVVGSVALIQVNESSVPLTNVLVQTLATERADRLNIDFGAVAPALHQLTTQPDIVTNLSKLAGQPTDSAALMAVQGTLTTVTETYTAIKELRFVSTTGTILASVPDPSAANADQETWFGQLKSQDSLDHVYIDRLVQSPSGDTIAAVDIVVANGQKVGYVVATIAPVLNASGIYSALVNFSYAQGNIVFYMLEADGTIEAPFLTPINLTQATATILRHLVKAVETEPYTYISPVTGVQSVGISVSLPLYNRVLVAETPSVTIADVNIASPTTLQDLSILALAILVLIVAGLLFDAAVVRPVRQFRSAIMPIAQGSSTLKLGSRIPQDEIGDLYRIYNTLSSRLITDDQTLNQRVKEHTEALTASQDVRRLLFATRDVPTILERVTALILDRFKNVHHLQVYLMDSSGQVAVLRAASGDTGKAFMAREVRIAINEKSPIGRAVLNRQVVITRGDALDADSADNPMRTDLRRALLDMRAELTLPLISFATIIGVIDLYSHDRDTFTASDIRLFREIVDTLAQVIANARRFEELTTRLLEAEALNQRSLGEAWQNYALSRRHETQPGPMIEPWSDLQRQAVQTQHIVEREGSEMITFAVPITLRGQILGAVEWDVPRRAYTDNTRQLANDLAARLAISADNARLFEQSERLAQRERLVNDISSKLIQQTEVSEILQIAVEEVGKALRVPQTAIRLASTDSDLK